MVIRRGPALLLLVVAASFAVGFAATQTMLQQRPLLPNPMRNVLLTNALLDSEGERLGEVLLVYVGSSSCVWSSEPEVFRAFKEARDVVARWANESGAHFSAVGVDLDPPRGGEMGHLSAIGTFDQVVLGGGILNILGSEVTWGSLTGPPGTPTPQLLVLTRGLRKVSRRGDPLVLDIDRFDLLVRKVGLSEIEMWEEDGFLTAPAPWMVEG